MVKHTHNHFKLRKIAAYLVVFVIVFAIGSLLARVLRVGTDQSRSDTKGATVLEGTANQETVLPINLSPPVSKILRVSAKWPLGVEKIAFIRGRKIFMLTKGGRDEFLTKGSAPALSPDGKTLAYLDDPQNRDSAAETVSLMDLTSKKVRRLGSLIGYGAAKIAWSHDGKKLAFSFHSADRGDCGYVSLATQEVKVLSKGIRDNVDMDVSAWDQSDSHVICYDFNNIYLFNVDETPVQTRSMDGLHFENLMLPCLFSPDEKQILFNEEIDPDQNCYLNLYDMETNCLRRITPLDLDARNAQWLPGGREILFESQNPLNRGKDDICVLNLDENSVRTIVRGVSQYLPTFSK